MKKNILLLLGLILFFAACEKDEPSNLWTISGEVRMQDAQVPEITTPLAGIKIYLLKAPFTMDSLNWFTKTDILDSVLTDADGLYKYNQLLPGDYVVMATDTIVGYSFDWTKSPDPVGFTAENAQKEYTVNFTTLEPIMENSESMMFTFNHSGDVNICKDVSITSRYRIRFGCGWWFSEPCDWWPQLNGWAQNYPIVNTTFNKSSDIPQLPPFVPSLFYVHKETTNSIYEYENIFLIRFRTGTISPLNVNGIMATDMDTVYTMTISGDDLSDENIYDVIWHLDNVEVTRTN